MNGWPVIPLGDRCDVITKGTTPTTLGYAFSASGIPFIRVENVGDVNVRIDRDILFIDETTHRALSRSHVRSGDLLVSIAGTIGRVSIVQDGAPPLNCNQAIAIVRASPEFHRPYLRHWLRSHGAQDQMRGAAVTGTISNLSLSQLGRLKVPLPPIAEQRRIAEILDKADALRAKRRAALAQLDTLTQSIFLDMFGDPATNRKEWPMRPLESVAVKFSDGPFGSNLKTDHYRDTGVRVIRLQNVGVGKFLDENRAFVSPEHFERLRKHECVPNDVIIATMGDPNLRACVLPPSIRTALNKADCIQMRVDKLQTNSDYICTLLNHPSTLKLAQDLIHGQTRVRISMGQLRLLRVPIPPIELQNEFVRSASAVKRLRDAQESSYSQSDALFASLQHRAFRGEL